MQYFSTPRFVLSLRYSPSSLPPFLLLLALLSASWHRARLRGTKKSSMWTKDTQTHTKTHSKDKTTLFNLLTFLPGLKIIGQLNTGGHRAWETETHTHIQHCKNTQRGSSSKTQKCCSGRLSIFLTHISVSYFSKWPDSARSSLGF